MNQEIFDKLKSIDIQHIKKEKLKGRFFARCIKCYDGDTPTFVIYNNEKIEIITCRIYGIDTPEIRGSEKILAIMARNKLMSLITDQEIEIDKEYTKIELEEILKKNTKIVEINILDITEKYGRILCDVFVDNKNVSELMISQGYGSVYYDGKKRT